LPQFVVLMCSKSLTSGRFPAAFKPAVVCPLRRQAGVLLSVKFNT